MFTSKARLLSGNVTGLVIPVVLDWTVGQMSCTVADTRPEFGCISKNSECLESTSSAYGYVCQCKDGYNGNPYVTDGCHGSGTGIRLAAGVNLVAHFIMLFNQDKLGEILDGHVSEEGEDDAKQVAAIAAKCLRLKGENRPTMRNVEMRLQRLQGSDIDLSGVDEQLAELDGLAFGGETANAGYNYSRQYSIEEEFLLSASFER
nr:unnamed protein product [Digitaria exilis]